MRIGTYKYQREHSRVKRIGHMSGRGCFGTRKTIGVKEVHLITNGFDRDVKMAEEISNFYCSTTPEII